MSDQREAKRRQRAMAWKEADPRYTPEEQADRRFFESVGRRKPHDLMIFCAGDRGRDAEVEALRRALQGAEDTALDLAGQLREAQAAIREAHDKLTGRAGTATSWQEVERWQNTPAVKAAMEGR